MKNVLFSLVPTILFLFLFQPFAGGTTILTGKAIDGDTGEIMIGLSIRVGYSTEGVLTDTEGYFTLSVPDDAEELILGFYCFGDNSVMWCGQEEGLLILGPKKATFYGENGRKSCGLGKRTRRSRRYAEQHFQGIKAYRQRQLDNAKHSSSGQQRTLTFSSSLKQGIDDFSLKEKLELGLVRQRDESRWTPATDTVPGREISGIVLADDGESLIGATILFCENSGTVTDIDGAFSIFVPEECPTLTISYTGFTTKEVRVIDLVSSQGIALDVILELSEDRVICFGPALWMADPQTSPSTVAPAQLPPVHYTHPNQLFRGQLPGLVVSQAGNNPWTEPHLRQQGIQSFTQRADPIWAVDGMPGIEPLLLDQQSLQRVHLLRRPVDLVRYGLQGGAGVLEVSTEPEIFDKLEVQYQGQFSMEQPVRLPDVATAKEYRQNPGGIADFGFGTDWLNEVTRTAWSQGHQVRLQGRDDGTQWSAAGSFRDVQGVGRNSNFKQFAGRVQLRQRWWNDKLQIKVQAAGQQRRGERDYENTFFYATKYNPTAPMLFESVPENPLLRFYYDNSTLFLHNYFETITEADFFNPLAIQAANSLLEERANRWVLGELRLELADPLQLRVQAGRQANDWISGEENRTFSFFRGAALSPFPGAAQRQRLEQRQNWIRGTIEYTRDFKDGLLEVKGGYEFQKRDIEESGAQGFGFGNDDFSYDNFEFFLVDESQLIQDNYNEGSRLISFFTEEKLRWRWLDLRTAINYQGGTRLGTNQQWHTYWGSDARLNLNEIFDLSGNTDYFLHAGYVQLGNQPRDRTYARGQFDVNQDEYVNSNPDLRPERRRVSTGGFGWRNRFGFYGSIDYFASFLRDPIVKIVRADLPQGNNEFGENLPQLGLRNRSWEFTLGYRTDHSLSWTTELRWAYTKTRLIGTGREGTVNYVDENGQREVFAAGPGGFLWSNGVGLLELDAPFGQLIGLQFDERLTIASGQYTYSEVFQGNGLAGLNQDIGIIGNGLPVHTFGWSNQLKWGWWQVNLLIRAELGHDLANLRRGELETTIDQEDLYPQSRNYWSTRYDLPGNVSGFPQFSDRYIESGTYLSLDYLSLSREFALGNQSLLTVSLTAQNFLLFTDYTGTDPSPRFVDGGPEINGAVPNLPERVGQLVPGVDRRYFYPRTQTFTFGIRLDL